MAFRTLIVIDRENFRLEYGRALFAGDASQDITLYNYADFRTSTSHFRIMAGGGNDIIYGAAGIVYGGDGDDRFLNNGTSPDDIARIGASVMFGGNGSDRFEDHVGSTDYFGGYGDDVFSTYQGSIALNHSYPGDIDRAWLGSGNDTAQVAINTTSSSAGVRPENRLIQIDGGSGVDRVVYNSINVFGAINGDANGLLDMNVARQGTLRFYNTEITNFESFDLTVVLGRISTIKLGAGDDRIEMTTIAHFTVMANSPIRVFLGAGDDLAIGMNGDRPEAIFGGAGDDTLVSNGARGHGGMDTLSGGDGDDILATQMISVGNARANMLGGAGADLFLINNGYSANLVLRDFVQGEDQIVLNSSDVWIDGRSTSGSDIRNAVRPGNDMVVVRDTDSWLNLVADPRGPHFNENIELRYSRDTGDFWIRHISQVLGGREWEYLGRVQGAPDLTQDDFGFF